MKKLKPTKEELMQYIYDKGIDSTAKLFGLTKEEIENMLYSPVYKSIYEHKQSTKQASINNVIALLIAENYDYLWNKFVTDKSTLRLSQSKEDIFQSTLLKVMERPEVIESDILDYIQKELKLTEYQLQMDNYQLKNIFKDAVSY